MTPVGRTRDRIALQVDARHVDRFVDVGSEIIRPGIGEIVTDAEGTMRISLRDFRPHVELLIAANQRDLATRLAQDYLNFILKDERISRAGW